MSEPEQVYKVEDVDIPGCKQITGPSRSVLVPEVPAFDAPDLVCRASESAYAAGQRTADARLREAAEEVVAYATRYPANLPHELVLKLRTALKG